MNMKNILKICEARVDYCLDLLNKPELDSIDRIIISDTVNFLVELGYDSEELRYLVELKNNYFGMRGQDYHE